MSGAGRRREGDPEETGRARGFLEDLPTLALAIGIALLIRTFAFQSFYVPSESMLPTLLIGDHVFVSKLAYGPRVPLTTARAPGYREPRRGDVVVFHLARGGSRIYAADHRPDLPTEAFIKRLVALPGETVEIREGVVWIDGEPQVQTPRHEKHAGPDGREIDVLVEALGTCRHHILDDPRVPPFQMAPVVVPEDRYFFLGDNRDNSYDSRFWGTVRNAEIEGPAGLLYWSWDWNGTWLSLLNPLTWVDNLLHKTRWSRQGDLVQCLDPSGDGDGDLPAS